jgi:hypothetical protein
MSRFRQGFELAGISWRTLRSDRSLIAFPVLGGISVLAFGAAFVIPGALLVSGDGGNGATALAIVLFAIAAYLAAFIGTFFSVALAACAARALEGHRTTVREGLAAARHRVPQIAGWAAVVATINLIIRAIESRFEGVGASILAALGGLAWSLVTFLAVPVIAFEGTGPWATLRRSSSIFRERWGQQVGGLAATSGVVALFGVIPGILMIFGGFALAPAAAGIALIVIGIVVVVVASVLAGVLSQILAVALYRFAAEGVAVGPFTEEQLRSVVRPRGLRRGGTADPGTAT